jgi:anti-sigma regulatory factor (Ser/Thr protein kinase)
MDSAVMHPHAVAFYDDDAEVVGQVSTFIADGLAQGDQVITLATPPHRGEIKRSLARSSGDLGSREGSGQLVALDAAEILATFMHGDTIDPDRFLRQIGSRIDEAAAGGRRVRIFGEMVAVLWEAGNVSAAIELEARWNELARSRPFTLLCAYPTQLFGAGSLTDVNRMCGLHSTVHAPATNRSSSTVRAEHPSDRTTHLFLPGPSAARAARSLTADVLHSWGQHAILDDALIIVSELATNAAVHATSAFRVHLSRGPGSLRISVEDGEAARPQLRRPSPDQPGGRGLRLVQSLAQRWGCDSTPDGKTVWADLATPA